MSEETHEHKALETLERMANMPGAGNDMILWDEHSNAVINVVRELAEAREEIEILKVAKKSLNDLWLVEVERLKSTREELTREKQRAEDNGKLTHDLGIELVNLKAERSTIKEGNLIIRVTWFREVPDEPWISAVNGEVGTAQLESMEKQVAVDCADQCWGFKWIW